MVILALFTLIIFCIFAFIFMVGLFSVLDALNFILKGEKSNYGIDSSNDSNSNV